MQRYRMALHALCLTTVLLALVAPRVMAYDASDTLAAIEQASENTGISETWISRVIHCEDRTLDPNAVGDHGRSYGIAQLNTLPTGLYWHFVEIGYTDAFDPYQSAEYLARAFRGDFADRGIGAWRWSCR